MKKLFFLSVAATLISSLSFAKVWRINNIPTIATNFTSVDVCLASASVHDGDTLHLEGSPTTYPDFGVTKGVTIIGPGYFLNSLPALQYNVNSATVSSITIYVPNVKIHGLNVVSGIAIYGVEYGYTAGNVVLSRNYIGTLGTAGTMNNITVTQNVIGSFGTSYPLTNLLLTNNIIHLGFGGSAGSLGVIEYNVFGTYYYSQLSLAFAEGTYSFNGNIVLAINYYNSGAISGTTNTVFGYNMTDGNLFPAGGGNQNGVDLSGANVFVDGTQDPGAFATDTKWQLSASSPAKTAGVGGTPIGAFGGTNAYRLSGIPAIPSIYKLSIPSAIATGSSVPVTFSSKSNN